MKGKKCPRYGCNEMWVWDWDMDIYKNTETKKFCIQQDIYEDKEEEREVSLFKCTCGTVLSVQVIDDFGGMIYNHPDWEGIDWEDDQYSV